MPRPRYEWHHPIIVARFLSKLYVVEGSECIECEGTAPLGWVRFVAWGFPGVPSGQVYAHRYSYAITFGLAALLKAPTLDHKCRNRGCVNPYHLEPLTFEDHGAKSRAEQLADVDPFAGGIDPGSDGVWL